VIHSKPSFPFAPQRSFPAPSRRRAMLTGMAAAAVVSVLVLAGGDAVAQVCGDVNGDDKVTTSDAQRVLRSAVGQNVELVCTDKCAVLEARVAALEALLDHVTVVGNNLVLTGMNFQVVSGAGTTTSAVNGTGNIIIGYNESNSNKDKRTGSHNLVIGRYHSYSNYGGIAAGEDNEITGKVASVLGGALNLASGDGSVVVSGQDNWASHATAVVLAGEGNRAGGRSCSVSSGNGNLCSGLAAGISGGAQNTCTGTSALLSGGVGRTLNSNGAWMAGGLFQAQ
jgi:hypothetical protein